MAQLLEISADDSRRLRSIVEMLGLGQQQLKTSAQLSAAWLSLVLNIKGDASKPVEAEMIERVARALVGEIKNRLDGDNIPKERLKGALEFLSRYTNAAAALIPPKIYTSGGPIPGDAAHYIIRLEDSLVLSALQKPAFTMIIRGPVQCGKSSWLARLESKAREKGFETTAFDLWGTVAPVWDTAKEPAEVIAVTAGKLAETLQVEWRLEPPSGGTIDSLTKLSNWLWSALASVARKPRLIILDDLASLGATAAEEWLSFVRVVDTKRASHNQHISVAVGLTHHFGPSFARKLDEVSSIVHWSPRIELGWLDEDKHDGKQSAELESKLSNEGLNLYPLFRGQPYLTHAAVEDKAFRESVERWTRDQSAKNQLSVRGALPYTRHLKAIRLTLFGPPWQDQTIARKLVNSFLDACKASRNLSESDRDRDHEVFLKTAKLLNDDGEPVLPIYPLIAKDLSDQLTAE